MVGVENKVPVLWRSDEVAIEFDRQSYSKSGTAHL